MPKQSYPAHPEVPISKAVRAGDFVFTSAYGPWTFDPARVVFDQSGRIVDDGTGRRNVPFDQQVHLTDRIRSAMRSRSPAARSPTSWTARCGSPMRAISSASMRSIAPTLLRTRPVRSVFPIGFMFDVKVEMKVAAYKPLGKA